MPVSANWTSVEAVAACSLNYATSIHPQGPVGRMGWNYDEGGMTRMAFEKMGAGCAGLLAPVAFFGLLVGPAAAQQPGSRSDCGALANLRVPGVALTITGTHWTEAGVAPATAALQSGVKLPAY